MIVWCIIYTASKTNWHSLREVPSGSGLPSSFVVELQLFIITFPSFLCLWAFLPHRRHVLRIRLTVDLFRGNMYRFNRLIMVCILSDISTRKPGELPNLQTSTSILPNSPAGSLRSTSDLCSSCIVSLKCTQSLVFLRSFLLPLSGGYRDWTTSGELELRSGRRYVMLHMVVPTPCFNTFTSQ